jgi:hypothetical protein
MQRGIPLGKPPVVELRNQHAQYAATWYVPLYTSTLLSPYPPDHSSLITRSVESPRQRHLCRAYRQIANTQVLPLSSNISHASPPPKTRQDRTQIKAMAWIDQIES